MAENKKVMEEEAVDTKETKAEQRTDFSDLPFRSHHPHSVLLFLRQ